MEERKDDPTPSPARIIVADDLALPRRFGDYVLLDALAHGGMGDVWLARQERFAGIEKLCVVKTIRASLTEDSEYRDRFIDEARTVVRLSHRNICPVLDVGQVNDEYFLAMDYVSGFDFRALFLRAREVSASIDTSVAVYLVAEMLEALDYAHRLTDVSTGKALRLVHRDVSLHNAIVNLEGEVKLIDFGLAHSTLKVLQTGPGVVLGKIAYMAPEHARGARIDGRADQFSAAIVLYELLTGERYYGDAPSAIITTLIGRGYVAPRMTSIAEPLRVVLARALDDDVDRRFPTCAAMRKALIAAHAPAGTEEARAQLDRFFPDARETHGARMARAAAMAQDVAVHFDARRVQSQTSFVQPATSTLDDTKEPSTGDDARRPEVTIVDARPADGGPTTAPALEGRSAEVATTIESAPLTLEHPTAVIAREETRGRAWPVVVGVTAGALLVAVAALVAVSAGRSPSSPPPSSSRPTATVPTPAPVAPAPAPLPAPAPATAKDDGDVPLADIDAATAPSKRIAVRRHAHDAPAAPTAPTHDKVREKEPEPVKPARPPLPSSAPQSLLELARVLEASCTDVVPCASGARARVGAANQSNDVGVLRSTRAAAEHCFAECRAKMP